MRLLPIIFLVILSFTSCKSSKLSTQKHERSTNFDSSKNAALRNKTTANIISHAKTFNGTKYKFGGTTKKGMDCSGLIYIAFRKEDISLPRVSRDMATKGKAIKQHNVRKGDLLFFKTNKNRSTINHVGLVVNSKKGVISFIHSTSNKGVITSSLSESYWRKSFIQARRIL